MSHPIGLQVLRAKVRGFHAAGSTISRLIHGSTRERRNRLWNEKRALGVHCRYHQVAYGLLRGVPYLQIERCAPNNRLNPERLLEVMLAHATWQQKTYVPGRIDLDRVKELLMVLTVAAAPVAASEPSLPPTVASLPTQSPAQTPRSTSTRLLEGLRSLLVKGA